MKPKTEARRQTILDIAEVVFAEMGFERASMDEVSQRGGGSKATIYNYFRSKEELFLQVIYRSTESQFEATHAALDFDEPDIQRGLELFGERFLAMLYSPNAQAMRRLVISEGGRNELGPKFYELAPERSFSLMSQAVEKAMEQGKLRRADSYVACLQLKALLEAELVDRFLFHVLDTVNETQIRVVVKRAVSAFLAIYGRD